MTPFNSFVVSTFIITYTPGDVPGVLYFYSVSLYSITSSGEAEYCLPSVEYSS